MSATKRNGRKPRRDGNYATPLWAVRAVLPHLPAGTRVLDPCAGKGNILKVLKEVYSEENTLFGIELNPDRSRECLAIPGVTVVNANALAAHVGWHKPDLIVMNPPFGLAEIFCRIALNRIAENGTVAVLLRMSFAASIMRQLFWSKYTADMLVLSRRPSFDKVGDSDTDSCDYAWFIFGPQATGKWMRLEVSDQLKNNEDGG